MWLLKIHNVSSIYIILFMSHTYLESTLFFLRDTYYTGNKVHQNMHYLYFMKFTKGTPNEK